MINPWAKSEKIAIAWPPRAMVVTQTKRARRSSPCFPRMASQQLAIALGVARIRAGVTRGVNPWSAAKRIDHQARILREYHLRSELAIVQRLSCAIFGKCRSRFFKCGQLAEIRKEFDLQAVGAAGQFLIFSELSPIRRRNQNSGQIFRSPISVLSGAATEFHVQQFLLLSSKVANSADGQIEKALQLFICIGAPFRARLHFYKASA